MNARQAFIEMLIAIVSCAAICASAFHFGGWWGALLAVGSIMFMAVATNV